MLLQREFVVGREEWLQRFADRSYVANLGKSKPEVVNGRILLRFGTCFLRPPDAEMNELAGRLGIAIEEVAAIFLLIEQSVKVAQQRETVFFFTGEGLKNRQ